MKFLLRAAAHRYGNWIYRREDELSSRATDRIVRPFELGLEWAERWPITRDFPPDGSDPIEYLVHLNQRIISSSGEFFSYDSPDAFDVRDNWLTFASPVVTPYPENNTVRGLWFPARGAGRKAVVVLPHWNAKLPQHNALCAGLQRLGISALRLSLPYHDMRTPAGLQRADYAMSANICRTIDATRQAIVDTRACFDWLEREGYTEIGIVGTSIGSCYAFIVSAHDPRIRVNVFNHCSTYVADVVWEGLDASHSRWRVRFSRLGDSTGTVAFDQPALLL